MLPDKVRSIEPLSVSLQKCGFLAKETGDRRQESGDREIE